MKRSIPFLITILSLVLASCVGAGQAKAPVTGATQPPATQSAATSSPSAAAGTTASPGTPTQPPTAAPSATSPATGTTSTTPSLVNPSLANQLSNTCALLNSDDLASILVTGELVKEPLKSSQVDHPIFSTQKVPTNEVTCIFYEFHNPGKKDEELLQVTYWVDLPGQGVTSSAWAQAWKDATKAGQEVTGIGDQAFLSSNGRLTFRQGNLYFTIEIVDTSRSADQRSQIARQVAADMLKRLAALPASG